MTDGPRMQVLIIALATIVVAVSATSQPRLAYLPKPCTPGEVTSDYCNSCTCQEDGQTFACTVYECPEPKTNEGWNYKLNPIAKRDAASGSCITGQTKQVNCYTCVCALNPPQWVCPEVGCI